MKQLILGGARSGKSQFAEQQALDMFSKQSTSAKLIYIATSPVIDAEMDERIIAHQSRRSADWQLVECPLDLPLQLSEYDDNAVILIDCLTLWLNNLIYEKQDVEKKIAELIESLTISDAQIILVSNELGMGLVSEIKTSREFRDHQGRLNQLIAQKVDKVAFVVAGLPLWMK